MLSAGVYKFWGGVIMQILISPTSKQEAGIVAQSDADIIDIKNVKEGSLGAQLPLITMDIVQFLKPLGKKVSATLGDLPYKPGTAALAALGLVKCGVDYIKAGLYGPENTSEAFDMIDAITATVKSCDDSLMVVASAYADWRRFKGLSPFDMVPAAEKAGADVVMVDTAIKDGATLFDNMTISEIKEFITLARDAHLLVALAGSLKREHLPELRQLHPDIIGVRGAVCETGNRENGITKQALDSFLDIAQEDVPSFVH
jgi:(5-formylfuran-3-yl)methyl phosphate synthase